MFRPSFIDGLFVMEKKYEAYFFDAYERMNRFDFPESENIYTYTCQDEGLGEIRSIYLAKN